MRGKRIFVGSALLLAATIGVLNAGTTFADKVHSFDADNVRVYDENVLKKVIEAFPEEKTNMNPVIIEDGTGDEPLSFTLNAVYGMTASDDEIGVYYYDENITLSDAPFDEVNEGIVETEAVAKIHDFNLFDADEEEYTDDNRCSVLLNKHTAGENAGELIRYSFLQGFRQISSELESDEDEVEVLSKTFTITIPAHKKWGFYLINHTDETPHTYYTDEEFNIKDENYPDRRYSGITNIVANDKTYTIFGLEDWVANDRPGADEVCAEGGEFTVNCSDANDIVFIVNDIDEPDEPEEPEEPENPETGDSFISPISFAVFTLACFGLLSTRFLSRRN